MTEDQYRAELVHAWRMKRVAEVIAEVRKECLILEKDIDAIKAAMEEHEPCLAL